MYLKVLYRVLMAAAVYTLFRGQIAPAEVPEMNSTLEAGYDNMYNLEFAAAHRIFAQYQQNHPEDPMGPVSNAAAYLFFEFDRLHILRSDFFADNKKFLGGGKLQPDPKVQADFQAELTKARGLASARLQKNSADHDALLARVLATALDADYKALILKQYWQALNEIKESQNESEELLKVCADCYDGYLASGIENYLLSQRPAPERWLLQLTGAQTNKQVGMTQLRIVADKGHYLKPYAKILLAIAALRDNNRKEAKSYLVELSEKFPRNNLFHEELKRLSDCCA